MQVWRNARIRTKVLAGLVVAAAALAWFAGGVVIEKQRQATAARRVGTMTALTVKIGNLLHETQRERGRTAQFASSNGTRFGAELKAQQAATDARQAEYAQFASRHAGELPGAVRTALSALRQSLDTLSGLRAQAAAGKPTPTIISGYTALNRVLLASIAVAADQNANPTIGLRLQSYLALLSAKEDTGLERAQLTTVFTTGHFAPGQLNTVVSLIGSQRAYLTVFERAASTDVLQRWSQIQASNVVADVAALEKTALDRAGTGSFGVSGTDWFNAATAKIDLYKTLEDYQSGDIQAAAGADAAAADRAATLALVLTGTSLALTLGMAALVIVSITRPLRRVTVVARQMATGAIPDDFAAESRDELGQLVASFRELAAYLRESADLAHALAQGDLTRIHTPRSERDLLGNALRETVLRLNSILGQIQSCGTGLSRSAGQLIDGNTVLMENSADTAAKAGSLSAASEQMNASIADISRNTSHAATVAVEAVATATRAGTVIVDLAQASGEINGVVELIQSIASQTNLLALNATIEAARAGAAGRGFGVVADEVKQLAQQTAHATATITARVESIQSGAAAAAGAIGQIGDIVNQIEEIATTIAGAVEEQAATTAEITRSVTAVADAAGTTTKVTNEAAESARVLADTAGVLDGLVAQFTVAANR